MNTDTPATDTTRDRRIGLIIVAVFALLAAGLGLGYLAFGGSEAPELASQPISSSDPSHPKYDVLIGYDDHFAVFDTTQMDGHAGANCMLFDQGYAPQAVYDNQWASFGENEFFGMPAQEVTQATTAMLNWGTDTYCPEYTDLVQSFFESNW